MDDEYSTLRDFTDHVSGDLARRKAAMMALKQEDDGENKKAIYVHATIIILISITE